MLRQLPMLDMLAMASVSVEAPTVMELGALAGDMVQASPPLLLPAAVTTVMPAAEAASMASFCSQQQHNTQGHDHTTWPWGRENRTYVHHHVTTT
jgi:hypothetical protein